MITVIMRMSVRDLILEQKVHPVFAEDQTVGPSNGAPATLAATGTSGTDLIPIQKGGETQ